MPKRAGSAGYTIAEVMMGIFIVSIGFLGLTGMHTTGFYQTRALQDTVAGLNCAQHFIEILREESLTWTTDNPLNSTGNWSHLSKTGSWSYLKNYPTTKTAGTSTNWMLAAPTTSDKRLNYICGDAKFNTSVNSVIEGGNKKYCLHYRLTWLIVDYLLRVDVRVMWPTPRSNWNSYKTCPLPTAGQNTGGMADDMGMVDYVTLSSTVMQNTNILIE